jgi:hypothetical protein
MSGADRPEAAITLYVRAGPHGRFEVRAGPQVLGSSQNELMAVWSAIGFAEEMTKSGRKSRVVRLVAGEEVEEWPAAHSESG